MESNYWGNPPKEKLKNATTVLILGIVTIVLDLLSCCCYGFIPGLITGIIGLVLGYGDKKLYQADPKRYDENSYNQLNAGWIMSLIGMILAAIMVFIVIVVLVLYGIEAVNPGYLKQKLGR